jgi:ABC-type glutathione transport system ATPase component
MATAEPETYGPVVSHPQSNTLTSILTRASAASGLSRQRTNRIYDDSDDDDGEAFECDWKLMPELKAFRQQGEKDQVKGRKLGVTWTDLTVKGVGADAAFNENVGSQFNIPRAIKESRHGTPLKTILERSHGCVKPGEMLLVLGRPGAGCTTLLKILANRRLGYTEVTGDVHWGSLNPKQAYRGRTLLPNPHRWTDHRLCHAHESTLQSAVELRIT